MKTELQVSVIYLKNEANDINELEKRIADLFDTLRKLPYVTGYCYTQLSDVRQETNGLVDEERNLRLPLKNIKDFVEG